MADRRSQSLVGYNRASRQAGHCGDRLLQFHLLSFVLPFLRAVIVCNGNGVARSDRCHTREIWRRAGVQRHWRLPTRVLLRLFDELERDFVSCRIRRWRLLGRFVGERVVQCEYDGFFWPRKGLRKVTRGWKPQCCGWWFGQMPGHGCERRLSKRCRMQVIC